MYRCKDCGQEYKEKVDYCDCGNNTFDYIEDFAREQKSAKQPKIQKQPLSVEEKSQIVSWGFFALCILLSLIVWLIPIKVEQTIKEEINEQKIDTKSIPNLEEIWNNTPPKVEVKQEEKPQTLLDEIRVDLPDKIIPKQIEKPVQNKPVVQPVPKPIIQNKPVQNKPVAQINKQPKINRLPKTNLFKNRQNSRQYNPNRLQILII